MSATREFWVNAYAETANSTVTLGYAHDTKLGADIWACLSSTSNGGFRVPYRIHVKLKPKSEVMPS